MKSKWAILVMILISACLFLTGCGKKAGDMIQQAESALDQAREAEAQEYAPDEYLSAEESLSLAREQFDKRKYGAAKSSAITARDQANLALNRAQERKQQEEAEAGTEDQAELSYNVPSLYSEEQLEEGESVTALQVEDTAISSAALKDIHFDFDRYFLTEDARESMAGNAQWMKERPLIKIRIEGHCDERGSEEYNIALGAKRARSAQDYLIQLGINPSRLSTISYGESLPLDPGHNEDAWASNRRVHFVIVE